MKRGKSFANLQILQGLFTNEKLCLGVFLALAYAICGPSIPVAFPWSSIS